MGSNECTILVVEVHNRGGRGGGRQGVHGKSLDRLFSLAVNRKLLLKKNGLN